MSKYDYILDNMIFSFSNLTMFEQCPLAWYLKYINREPSSENCYAQFGSFCHKILEKYAKHEISKNELLNYYADNFDKEIPLLETCSSYDKYYMAGAKYFKNCELNLNYFEVIGVEEKVEFEIDRHKFVGYIDLLLKGNDNLIVLDHKSSEYPRTKNGAIKKKCIDKVISYKRQLYLYSKAIYDRYGKYPTKLAWNYFRDGKFDTVAFDVEEYYRSLEWAKDIIKAIYNENEFVGNEDYFYCKNLCDYREVCS